MRGTLFVVATPIGNLEDITLRALRILKEVQLVAAEDTRRTGNLLRHYGIATQLISLHGHNEHHRAEELVRRLQAGESIALVSDAGTPAISDPGSQVVRLAREAGVRVEPIPGPSAVTAILSASGLSLNRFAFVGFPPVGSKDRKSWFRWIEELEDAPVVCFEAPHRIHRTLGDIRKLLVDRPIIIARELTKVYEEWIFWDTTEMMVNLPEPKGEFVIVIGAAQPSSSPPMDVSDQEIGTLFGRMTKTNPMTRRAAIKQVAQRLNLSAKTVYVALERLKTAKETPESSCSESDQGTASPVTVASTAPTGIVDPGDLTKARERR